MLASLSSSPISFHGFVRVEPAVVTHSSLDVLFRSLRGLIGTLLPEDVFLSLGYSRMLPPFYFLSPIKQNDLLAFNCVIPASLP